MTEPEAVAGLRPAAIRQPRERGEQACFCQFLSICQRGAGVVAYFNSMEYINDKE